MGFVEAHGHQGVLATPGAAVDGRTRRPRTLGCRPAWGPTPLMARVRNPFPTSTGNVNNGIKT